MRLKDFIRKARFENYNLKIEGQESYKLVSKDDAMYKFGYMKVTEIDYGIIFVNTSYSYENDNYDNHKTLVVPSLILLDQL